MGGILPGFLYDSIAGRAHCLHTSIMEKVLQTSCQLQGNCSLSNKRSLSRRSQVLDNLSYSICANGTNISTTYVYTYMQVIIAYTQRVQCVARQGTQR